MVRVWAPPALRGLYLCVWCILCASCTLAPPLVVAQAEALGRPAPPFEGAPRAIHSDATRGGGSGGGGNSGDGVDRDDGGGIVVEKVQLWTPGYNSVASTAASSSTASSTTASTSRDLTASGQPSRIVLMSPDESKTSASSVATSEVTERPAPEHEQHGGSADSPRHNGDDKTLEGSEEKGEAEDKEEVEREEKYSAEFEREMDSLALLLELTPVQLR